jgi:FkbM family methyltransferase
MIKRLLQLAAVALVLLTVATAAGYFGMRVGRKFALNQLCCALPQRQNFEISVRETLGFVKFPSQIGQDRWVAEAVFPGVTNGYFLDVGSADGFVNSNTWALEHKGWKGICVDPFPSNMTGRTCQMFREAVDAEGGQKIQFAAAGELGGITNYLDRWKDQTKGAKTVELTTITLRDILQRAHAPSFIHFMSLDIEGAELGALKGFPFDEYKLGSLAIEHNYEEPKRTEIEQLLKSKGYSRSRTWLQDDFYLPTPPPKAH